MKSVDVRASECFRPEPHRLVITLYGQVAPDAQLLAMESIAGSLRRVLNAIICGFVG